MPTPSHRRQRGLTLIESLVAFLALSVGALALLRFQPELRQHAEFARQRSEALRLAQQDLEVLRSITSLAEFAAIVDHAATIEPDGVGGPRFALQRRVDAVAWPGLRDVEVTVSWLDRHGQTQTVGLATLLAAHEPALAAASLLAR
jgi:type II secretory pathway pseudopilin PulG